MMIISWVESVNYDKYYEQCAPSICTYILITRNHLLYVFTTMISLLAGVSTALRILIPIIINWIRNRIHRTSENNNPTNSLTIFQRLYNIWCKIKTKIIELNLFKSELSLNNQTRRHYEIITTRIYILLLAIFIIILIFYTIISVQVHSRTDDDLSRSKFERLISNPDYLSTLDCPCQNISISYNSFISISPNFHQICSSDFIIKNSEWINLIYKNLYDFKYSHNDYHLFSVSHFRFLYQLCRFANDTFAHALDVFRSNILISKRAQSHQAVLGQMNGNINQFISSISQTFIHTLDFNQQIAQGSGFISSIGSNWYMKPNEDKIGAVWGGYHGRLMLIFAHLYENKKCSCSKNSTCSELAYINRKLISGFRVGCHPLQSLLQSTLECLYDEMCIQILTKNKQVPNMIFRPLNRSLSSPNITVRNILNTLMVDEWKYDINYDNYYRSCSPTSCTYVIKNRFDIKNIIITIVSFYTGLSVILQIIAPVIGKIFIYISMRRQRQIQPTVAIIDSQ